MNRVITTLNKMLEDRGYEPMDTTEYTDGRIFMKTNTGETLFIKINTKDGKRVLGTEDIHSLIETCRSADAKRGIIVGNGVSSQAGDLIETNNESSSEIILEFFDIERLQYNPTQTILYNPHTLVTETELEEIRQIYGENYSQSLPKLLASECPIVKYFGWLRGDVIKITRIPKKIREFTPRKTAQIVYRVVE
jgi:DNA-directed RNA polymerase subunit H (RpoH/RPB5)